MDLLAVGQVGPYPKIGDAFFTLAQWLSARGVHRSGARLVGIYYDDPDRVGLIAFVSDGVAGAGAPAASVNVSLGLSFRFFWFTCI